MVKVNSGCLLSSSITRGMGLTEFNAFSKVRGDIPFVIASFSKSLSQLSNVVAEAFSEAKQITNDKRLIAMQSGNFIVLSTKTSSFSNLYYINTPYLVIINLSLNDLIDNFFIKKTFSGLTSTTLPSTSLR